MVRDLAHFQLTRWQEPIPRKAHGGGRPVTRTSREQHGQALLQQAGEILDSFTTKVNTSPTGINPSLVFKLQLHSEGNLDDKQIEQLGLRLLSRGPNGAIVVFPNEATLKELRQRISEYTGLMPGGHKYGEISSIEEILELTAEDRIGERLKRNPLELGEIAALDIELFHSGDRALCLRQIQEITTYLRSQNLNVTDSWIGENLCLLRAQLNVEALQVILTNTDYVKEVDRRPEPSYETLGIARADLNQIEIDVSLLEDLIGVLVIDSGVMQRHPILGPTIGDAQVFPDRLQQKILGGAEDGDEVQGGHGTAVAGIAVFNDVGECIVQKKFTALAQLFSARITDEFNQYDEEELIEHQLEDILDYFLNNYSNVKVINFSHGDIRLVYKNDKFQFRLAAAIDELAYRFRDRELIFIVSTGNLGLPEGLTEEDIKREYPKYLLHDDSRIVEPATSALALTVGGLSYGIGKDRFGLYEKGTEQVIAGVKGWPSPFSRTGWGLNESIKPDVVDFAGDWRFERGSISPGHYAGLPTTSKNFSPPSGNLFSLVSGTSFAAPRIANLAAQLFREFPSASSNLIKALIVDSASIPHNRPPSLERKKSWEDDVLRIYGYGQPDFERARWSAQNDILFLDEGNLDLNSFVLYELPPLPDEFLTFKGQKSISVSLAFDPPTRITRADSYLGVIMEFALYRNIAPDALSTVLKRMSAEEKQSLEDKTELPSLTKLRKDNSFPIDIKMHPGTNKRKKGTLQRGLFEISQGNWQYDGRPLVLAITATRKWVPQTITSQRFAVVVSLHHSNPFVNLHAHVQQHARLFQRTRIRI